MSVGAVIGPTYLHSIPRTLWTARAPEIGVVPASSIRSGRKVQKRLRALQKPRLVAALRFGQALAAVNCGYEGARGTMMAMTRQQLAKRLTALAAKEPELELAEDDIGGLDVVIPKRLCRYCSVMPKPSGRKLLKRRTL